MTEDQPRMKANCRKTETGEVVCEGELDDGAQCFQELAPDGNGGFQLVEIGGDTTCQIELESHISQRV